MKVQLLLRALLPWHLPILQFKAFGSIVVLTLVGAATAARIEARQAVRSDNSMIMIWLLIWS